ncbi:putative NADP-dependent oxidoreductase domain-containing protein [Seiridium cardinale]|uniref:NADP-dependent oxidoreductase domain-containing protein n=1 Tax=Seiridium cardinale TaxID=138064 RepID=A0ABR2Y889_9PEZI
MPLIPTSTGKPRVILGLMTFGPSEKDGARITDISVYNSVLDKLQSRGYNEVDTARVYTGGNQEAFTREAKWKERGLKLATKVQYPSQDGDHIEEKVIKSVETSLKELGTDCIDILYIHAADRATPFEETLGALDKLHKAGKFVQLGLSNYTAFEVAEAVLIARQHGWVRPTIYQAMYNMITRGIDAELIPACRRYGLDVVVYNPIAGGLFSGKIKSKDIDPAQLEGRFSDNQPTGASYRSRYFKDSTFNALRTIEEAVSKHEGLTLIETALRWTVHHSGLKIKDGNDGVIIGISSLQQLDGNLDNLEKGPLPDDVVEAIDKAWLISKAEAPNYWHKDLLYKYDTIQALILFILPWSHSSHDIFLFTLQINSSGIVAHPARMAEAAAALSLAANILQMVEYGAGFVATAWKLWKSGSEGVTGLELLSQNLKNVSQQIQTDLSSPSNEPEEASGYGMFELAAECLKTTQEMLGTLDSLGLPTRGRKREAVKATFKLKWKMEDIRALQAKLESFRSQLTLGIVASLRLYAMRSLENQDMIIQQLSRSRSDGDESKLRIDQRTNRHKGFGSTVVGYLAYRRDFSVSSELGKSLRDSLFGAVYDPHYLPPGDPHGYDFGLTENRKDSLKRTYLSNLYYEGMDDRAMMVAEAHKNTFRWIYEPNETQEQPWDDFCTWLESEQQLYWITGKAGSGKSTLMKFVSQPYEHNSAGELHSERIRSMEHLRRWSGDQPLLVASFYFWAAGSTTQTSKSGLFRTLLYHLVDQHPNVLPYISPKRWEALCLFNEDPKTFTEDELRETLLRAILHLSASTKLCLFVDGLDEFDGDHGDLIDFLKDLVDTPSVKVCVASRPWVFFEDALNNRPSLRLEDLTFNDIREYVMSRLGADSNFSLLMRREFHFADKLVDQIVRKARGVFLWVNLVVSSLLDGMKYGDRVTDLQRRLDSLPPDLEDLYDRILDSLDPFYFEHATQYFRLMAACTQPPTALLFTYADEEDPTFALGPLEANPAYTEVELRVEVMQRRLNSRCKGLIEIGRKSPRSSIYTSPTVQYLHKTVKDYVERPDIQLSRYDLHLAS